MYRVVWYDTKRREWRPFSDQGHTDADVAKHFMVEYLKDEPVGTLVGVQERRGRVIIRGQICVWDDREGE